MKTSPPPFGSVLICLLAVVGLLLCMRVVVARAGQNIIARDKVWFPIEFHKPSHGFAPIGGVYATPADYNQKSSKESGSTCEDEHPSLNIRCVTFIVLCFGGIFLAFGPGMSLNNQRRVLRTSLVISGIGCCEIGLLFWFMTGVFPFSWGLPARWLPAKWNPCKQSHHSQAFPHGVTVAQKLLTPPWFSYYTNYMAMEKAQAAAGRLRYFMFTRSSQQETRFAPQSYRSLEALSQQKKPKKIGRPRLPKGEAISSCGRLLSETGGENHESSEPQLYRKL